MLRQAAILLLICAAGTALSYFYHPYRPALYQTEEKAAEGEITVREALEAERLGTPGVLWIDARKSQEYAASHVQGAINLNEYEYQKQLPAVIEALNTRMEAHVVVYCDAQKCTASKAIANQLREVHPAPDKIKILRGGWPAYQQVKNP